MCSERFRDHLRERTDRHKHTDQDIEVAVVVVAADDSEDDDEVDEVDDMDESDDTEEVEAKDVLDCICLSFFFLALAAAGGSIEISWK